jgi:hypothetical protein
VNLTRYPTSKAKPSQAGATIRNRGAGSVHIHQFSTMRKILQSAGESL